ncbi:hypothetical protein [Actinosynnema sp. NPDC020468]|uniref:hypothetical protein n=1 Tax=Actinosynnema sp. NPDC020468 TaxID=3154488 RepID=UPI003403C923
MEVGMDVRYLRGEPSMAFPRGRLLAVRGGRLHVFAPDGWDALDGVRPEHATPVDRAEAADWCVFEGVSPDVLDEVPMPD